MGTAPLAGRTVVTTRDQPGRLDQLLAEAGAIVLHVPLIAIEPIPGVEVTLDGAEWLVVTSQHGAAAVGALAAAHPEVRLAAVGTRTADVLAELAGRPTDLVPARQIATELVREFPAGTGRVVAALGDLASGDLAIGLEAKGWSTDTYVVYRTHAVVPDAGIRAALLDADAVAFASGSAATAWAASVGTDTPPRVVAIGPTTEAAARHAGLPVTHVATTYDVEGLVAAVIAALAE
ncbi:MAG TPA: uroporphyrinogen-III synthase [Ilumatobacter sp.]|nr:uroporphyrinogen-III synthase [Ilumatobacter sp.]